MKLHDLSPTQCAVINLIRQHGDTTRPRIVDELCRRGPHKMPEGTVSSSMSRLEGFGFIARPDSAGAGWRLTPEGAALFAFEDAEFVDPPCPEPQPQDAPNPEPEPEPTAAPFLATGLETLRALMDPLLPPPATDGPLAELSIIDQHLTFVRAALSAPPPLPAESARVYRGIVACLPAPLVEALSPITKLVEARS